jgi:hypothetical protein
VQAVPDIPELMRANLLDVFGERDPERRRAAIERTYHPDVVFSDPDALVTGHDALHAKAQKILNDAPADFAFSPAGKVYVNHDMGYLAWHLGPEGADPIVRGVDIALVRDGLIASVYTLLLDD